LLATGTYQRHWLRKNTEWFESNARLRILLLFFVLFALALFFAVAGGVEQVLRRGELRWVETLSSGWGVALAAWGLWMIRLERVSAQKFCAPDTRLFQGVTLLLALVISGAIHLRNAPPSEVHLAQRDVKRSKHADKIVKAAINYGKKNGELPSHEELEAHLSKATRKALEDDADLSYMPTDDDAVIVCGPFYLRQDIAGWQARKTRRGHKECVEIKENDDPESGQKGHTHFTTEDYTPPKNKQQTMLQKRRTCRGA
jgi:hypothetical protein